MKSVASASNDKEDEKGVSVSGKDGSSNVEKKGEEAESQKAIENKGRNIDLRLDLEKPERDGCGGVNAATGNKSQLQMQIPKQQQMPFKATKDEPFTDKSGNILYAFLLFLWPF